jgi:hypothetical protein
MGATILAWISVLAGIAEDGLAPWSSNHHPTDISRRHVQEITSGTATYSIVQGGTMDGRNCRSPQGVWQPFEQTWESNRSVWMENVGQTDVVDPWLSNGRDDCRGFNELVARAVSPGMTDAEKARALWWQEVQHRFHFEGDNAELMDPVKVFNIYGHNTCGNDSICLAGLWKKAGLRVAPARLVGHCVTQAFYDGRWHLMDGDMQSIYLLRDNLTVAGEQDLVRDHDLIRRTHTQGILQPDRRAGDEWESSIYVFEGKVNGDRNSPVDTSMSMILRPGEALVWRWGHLDPVKFHGQRPPNPPELVCNGLWEYKPDFTRTSWRRGARSVEAIKDGQDGLSAEAGATGAIVWTIKSPYVIVGGHLEIEGTGVSFAVSRDGRSWTDVSRDLDPLFKPQGPARYSYELKCQLSGKARLRSLKIVNDLQMAPLALPGMGIGSNTFTYTDRSTRERSVRVTHQWVERSASRPPTSPVEPISPRAGAEFEGTAPVFRWRPAADPDGDAIADYQFELSDRTDMRWPLSMSFAKLISRTSDAGQARYTLLEPGQLNPDQMYFWHVRAQDARGVWGPWSETWRFTPRGPAPPLDLALNLDRDESRGTLHWKPSPVGRRPTAYRVYASDEKGFSVSDTPYSVTIGVSDQLLSRFPANFVAETRSSTLEVVGPRLHLPGANKAFYRVVAVDEAGNRSGPSDYVEVRRPVIVSEPVTAAREGLKYRYPVAVIRSLGDLRTRVVGGKETMNFWELERPRFQIKEGPAWLSIDEATGLLSGTPDRPGESRVVVAVHLEQDDRRLDEGSLKWGIEKVVSSVTKTLGSANQSFVIAVAP